MYSHSMGLLFFLYSFSSLHAAELPCTVASPVQILNPEIYKNSTFEKLPSNSSVEQVTLSKQVKLEIKMSGCVDAKFTEFVFDLSDPPDFKSTLEWSKWIKNELESIRFKNNNLSLNYLNRFLKILENDKFKTDKKKIKLMVCIDGTAPVANDCSFNQSGAYKLEVTENKKNTVVSISYLTYL